MTKILLGTLAFVSLFLVSVLAISAADYPPRIEIDEVKARLDSGQQIIFVDTRNSSAWSRSNKIIPGAIRVRGAQEFAAVVKTLQKDTFIITYCT
jgi:rhodanese-related sulfurtransferase